MKDLTQGKEGKQILLFAIPMFIGNIFQQLYNIVDSIVVGKFVGSVALAAVGASFPILFTLSALVAGITIGGSVLVSQYFGAKNLKKVKITSDTLQIFLLISSIILTIIFFIFSKPIFQFLSIPDEVLPDAVRYFDIVIVTTTLPSFMLFGISAILRGVGNSLTPIYFTIGSIILNMILDLLFVLVFNWGIEGVAWATGISSVLAWLALWYHLNKREENIIKFNLNWKKWEFDWDNFRLSLKIGLPSGVQQTLVGLGNMALLGIVSPFGVATLAAYTAAGRVDMFVSMPAMNLAAALSSFVGQNLGAERFDRIRNGLWATLKYSTVICIFLTLIVVFFGENIMHLFVDSGSPYYEEIIKTGKEYLIIVTSFYILFTTMFVVNGVTRGAGATFVPMLITTLSLWIIRIPLAYILSDYFGAKGIWWSIPAGWTIGCIGAILYYNSGLWKKHRVKTAMS
ncbi:Multidrug export protein MepA [bioreactor metagenome]|jgi:putative MATE family efflux protein|uniref:Multidrug-efflux transporter n=1 Tax=bioreactor metagenome TaxID=1076179 RepID=A0A644UQD4_9ZZZZ|nr:MATE family efflux transporter [Bacteroidales bacterium]MBP6454480.1 MATE family efflux transporter [Bacteroidales bacterium]MBP9583692.1 MATE family efflux transporter [Bacteroidales bacterium]MBP9977962.1 MATE family efflux transporter [Bacteroidales bacterium]